MPNDLTLSVQQPWAWLIVNGYKPVENRTWRTNVRARIWIHAGQTIDHVGYEWVRATFPHVPLPSGGFARGGVIGHVDLIDCVTRHDSPWFVGPYGFVLANPEPMEFYPCRGQLGFFHSGIVDA